MRVGYFAKQKLEVFFPQHLHPSVTSNGRPKHPPPTNTTKTTNTTNTKNTTNTTNTNTTTSHIPQLSNHTAMHCTALHWVLHRSHFKSSFTKFHICGFFGNSKLLSPSLASTGHHHTCQMPWTALHCTLQHCMHIGLHIEMHIAYCTLQITLCCTKLLCVGWFTGIVLYLVVLYVNCCTKVDKLLHQSRKIVAPK